MAQSSAERVARIVLQYEVNRASAQAAAKSADDVSKQLTKVGIAADTVGMKAQSLQASFANIARQSELDRIAAQMSLARAQGESLETAVIRASSELNRLGATENEIDRVARAFDRAEKEARELAATEGALLKGGRLQGGALGRIGSELRLLPSVGIPGAGFGTDAIANVLRVAGAANTVISQLGISLGAIVTSAGIAGPALIAAGAAISAFTSEIERQKTAIRLIIDVNRERYLLERQLTTDQALERQQQLQDELIAARRTRDEVASAAESARGQIQGLISPVLTAFSLTPLGGGAGLGFENIQGEIATLASDAFTGLQTELSEAETELTKAQAALDGLNQSLSTNAFADQDAAEAARQLAEARIAGTRADADEAQRAAIEARTFALLTGEQAAARVEQIETENAGLMAAMEAISNSYGASTDMIRDAADRFFAEGQNDIESLRSALQAAGVPNELIDSYLDYRDQLRQNKDSIDGINVALREVILAREREIEAIKAQISAIQERASLEQQAFSLLQSGTVEGVDQRTTALLAEQAALSRTIPELQALAGTSDDAQKAFEDAQKRINSINNELRVLSAIRPDVAQRQYREEVEKLTASLVSDINKIEAARDNRIAQIESDLRVKEADLARDRSDALVDAERDAAEKRLAAIEDFREAEAKINRKFDRDFLSAVANRDALAAFEAKQAREDALQDEEQKLAKQNATISKAFDKQQRTIEDRYNKQLRTAREAANRAIQLERDKATAEINLRTQAYTAELQGLQNRLFAEFALQNQFWAASIALAQRAVASISQQAVRQITIPQTVQLPATTSQQQAYAQFAAYQRAQGIPGFATGLERVPYDNFVARLHKGEMVLPARQAQIIREGRSGGGNTLTLNLAGAQTRTIDIRSKAQAMRILEDYVDGFVGA